MQRIQLHRFSVTYPLFRLEPLSLDFSDGERVAIVGPNGSGKSTIMKAIAGLLSDYDGSIRVDGTEMRTATAEIRARIGLMPEELRAFGWMTVRQHLDFVSRFYGGWDRDYEKELLDRLALPEQARIGTLSKGMRVKLAFVTAEVHRPPILLLDEPTSGLDPVVRRELIDAVRECVPEDGGRLALFSTHILEDVEWLAERVVVLRHGRLELDTTVELLRRRTARDSVTNALYELLAGGAK